MRTMMKCAAVMAAFFLIGFLPTSQASAAYPITGSFLNFERGLVDPAWAYELDQEQAIGHDTISVLSAGQFVGSDQGTTCSPADVAGMSYSGGQLGTGSDKIGLIMSYAQARNMQVWVGSLQTSGAWNSPHLDACNRLVAQDLYSRFPGAVFAGMYSTFEIWLNSYQSPTSEAVTALAMLVASVNAAAPGKRVLIAPYFKKDDLAGVPGVSPTDAGNILGMVVLSTGVQVVAPQDGVGAQNGAPPLSETGSYFAAMKAALPQGTELWADLESFQYAPGVLQDKYPPAPIARIAQQVAAEQPYVSKIISWMFGRDMSPQATYYPIQASQLLMDYQSMYGGVAEYPLVPFTYTYDVGRQPSPSYSDPGNTKLTDNNGGGYGSDGSDWVGFLDTDDGDVWYLNLTLPYTVRVRKVRILFRNQMDSWIAWPYQILGYQSSGNELSGDIGGWWLTQPGPYLVLPPNPNSQTFSIGWAEWNEWVPTPVVTNYLRIRVAHVGWSMISEVEVYGDQQ